jgi:hypothetical protein
MNANEFIKELEALLLEYAKKNDVVVTSIGLDPHIHHQANDAKVIKYNIDFKVRTF